MRISDWSSDVCSSDLGGPATSLAPKRCAQMLELAGAKQQYSRYNMAGRIYPAQFSRISSHLRNQGHLNRNYNVAASSKQDIRKDARKRRSCFVESLPPAALRFAFHAPPTPLLRMIAPASCVALYMPLGNDR